SRQLADTDDPLVGDIPNVRLSHERECVVLTEREKGDRPLDDLGELAVCPAVTLGWEGRQQLGVAVVPVGGVEHRTQETARRLGGPGTIQVEPERPKYLSDIGLVSVPVDG